MLGPTCFPNCPDLFSLISKVVCADVGIKNDHFGHTMVNTKLMVIDIDGTRNDNYCRVKQGICYSKLPKKPQNVKRGAKQCESTILIPKILIRHHQYKVQITVIGPT